MRLQALFRYFVLLGVTMAGSVMNSSEAGSASLDWKTLPLPDITGKPMAPATLDGKVVLAVNTASFCGFTPQYAGLQALWRDYRDRGLVVLGIPSNDFGAQEPKGNSEIKEFCETSFDVDFPMLSKQAVIGPSAHPLYQWAAKTGPQAVPKWNFHKLLIGRDGQLAAAFGSRTEPSAPELRQAIEAALAR